MVQKGPGATMQKTQPPAQTVMDLEKVSQDPMKHVVTFIEKKIRNLDKRKAKLDGYRRMVEDGKPLDPDQTAAASKYDEVIGSLDFAKDLVKTFEGMTSEMMKQQRKASRREQMAREEADNNRVCFIVKASRIMELLHGNEAFREDFLNASNGACVVSSNEMDHLVNFYELFIMKSYDSGANILEDANAAGNHLYELAEGRSKDIVRTTYKDLNSLLCRIIDCKYFGELRDLDTVVDVQQPPRENENASISSESAAEDDTNETQKDSEANDTVQDDDAGDTEILSPNSTDPISSPSGYSADAPLKTEEFLPTSNAAPHTTHSDTWQQQQHLQQSTMHQKPEAGDYLAQDVTFQYTPNNNHEIMQRAYQAQRIQEVLAEVQGPCQFLQESIIDQEVTSTPIIPYSGLDMHQQPLPTTMPSHTRQMPPSLTGPTHLHASALESALQSIPPLDPARMTSQGLPVQQHPVSTDSASHIPSSVTPQEHLSIDQSPETLQNIAQDSIDQDNNFRGQSSFMPVTTASQQNMDYSLGHPSRQQADNLGLGQTTFGGQQQTQDSHLAYNEQTAFQNDKAQTGYTANVTHSMAPQVGGMQNMMQQHQLSSQSIQSTDSPVPHIPLPTEQQSGYRGFQAPETQQNEVKSGPPDDSRTQEQHSIGINNDQSSIDLSKTEPQDPAGEIGGPPQQPEPSVVRQGDQNSNYNPRNSNQHHSGHRGRGGYSNSGGYRGQGNQGSNYHQPRYNNNYRPSGGRYNNNYDNIARSGNNYGGGYQGNQSGNGYRQEQYGYRRGGGGMRGGRGGQGRGNPRGGGGYNRSRTFRPQHSNEQAA